MLRLTRRNNESIFVTTADGTTIEIIVDFRQGATAIGLWFDAPKSVQIVRRELQPSRPSASTIFRNKRIPATPAMEP